MNKLEKIKSTGHVASIILVDINNGNQYKFLFHRPEGKGPLERHQRKWEDNNILTNKPRGLSPQANYTDRETAACRRS
jgi:hypothetical protein